MTEVEENVYYFEREDEFDEVEEPRADKAEAFDESEDVDIVSPLPSVTPEDLLELRLFTQAK
jgi:hypothetical protein